MRLSTSVLVAAMVVGATAQEVKPQNRSDGQAGWDREKAAQYLDARMDMWFDQATKLTTGAGKTSCVSCHTVVPYLLARPVLRRAMGVSQPTPQEVKLLGEITQRVESYGSQESLYGPKAGESRGTEAVLNALILAIEDVRQHREQPSELTRKAFRRLWEEQRPDGGWDWLDFGNEPDESGDAQYYGAALAAIAVGTAPDLVKSKEGNTASHIDQLRTYLKGKYAAQNLYNRAWMLLASTRLAGLLSPEQRKGLMAELQANQNDDGGWSLYRLGPWRWSKTTAPFTPPGNPDVSLLVKSDGYATGLIAYLLRQAGSPSDDPTLKKATDWLKANQKDLQVDSGLWKLWRAHSLNHDRENGGERGAPGKRMVMSDSATAFAVLALLPPD
jgi:squalene-hopene/tetraprenyl-beta-curcumene cyclase